jgi:hypothetical protein
MTARTPLYWNGDQMQEMKSSQLTEIYNLAIYYYSLNPTVTLAVSSSGGNLTSINDTRLQAGAVSTNSSAFPAESTTAEPSTVTVAYQRITQSTSSVTPTSDSGTTYPVYYNSSGQIQAMNQTYFIDTFIIPAINLMAASDLTVQQSGTYHISTSTSVAGSTLVSSTPVFTDTRADTDAYTAAGITETQDQPTTITNYYLHQIDGALVNPSVVPTFIDTNNDLKQYSVANIGDLMGEQVRYQVVSSSAGYTLRYNIDGSGNSRGSSMVNTILTGGSGDYQTRAVSSSDYRAQEFPDGTPSTANTYVFKINKA